MAYGTFAFGKKVGMLTPDSVNSLKNAISGLNAEQAALALSTRGLTTAQQNQVLVEAGLVASSDRISASFVKQALLTDGLDKEQQESILIKAGLMHEDSKLLLSGEAVSAQRLKQILIENGYQEEQAETLINSILQEGQNYKEALSWKVLGTKAKEAAIAMLHNPLTWVISGIASIGLLVKGYDAVIGKKEKLSRTKIEGLDEDISKLDEEIRSLEELQSKLEDAKGSRYELSQIQTELNDAIGETQGLLNGESKAWDVANAKLKANIELKKQQRKQVQQDKVNESKVLYDNNAIEIDWHTYKSGKKAREYAKALGVMETYTDGKTDWESYLKFIESDDYKNLSQEVKTALGDAMTFKTTYDTEWAEYLKEQAETALSVFDETISNYDGAGGQEFIKGLISDMAQDGASLSEISDVVTQVIENQDMQDAINKYWESLVNPDINSEEALKAVKKIFDDIVAKNPALKDFFDNFYNGIVAGGKAATDTSSDVDKMTVSIGDLEKASDNIKTLGSAFKELSDEGYITTKTLGEIKTATGLADGEWKSYETTLLNAKRGSSEFNQAMSELTYKILENSIGTDKLANASESYIASVLRENGVTNAEAVAHDYLARTVSAEERAKVKLSIQNNIASVGIYGLIKKIEDEANACGVTTVAYGDLLAAEIVFGNNDLDVPSKLSQLATLEKAIYGVSYAYQTFGTSYSSGSRRLTNADARDNGKSRAQKEIEALWSKLSKKHASSIKSIIPNYDPNSKGSKTNDSAKDIAQKEKEFAENMAEAWKKEHLETLKDGLEEQKDLIERYKKNIEVLDFGLKQVETDDFSNRVDIVSSKLDKLKSYGMAMRVEFDRIANIIPQNGDEAQELAKRLEELGSAMRANVSTIRETTTELQKLGIEMVSTLVENRVKELQSELDSIDKRINILKSGHKDDYRYADSVLSMNMLLPVYSDFDKRRREKQKSDKALIDTEQETQDKINEIVTKSLKMQAEENAKAREKERQKLVEDMEKARQEVNKKLDETHNDYLDFLGDVKEDTTKAVNDITDTFSDAEIKLPEVDTSSVDIAIEETKKKLESLFDVNKQFNINLGDVGGDGKTNMSAVGGAVVPGYSRVSSYYGYRTHPITGEKKLHSGTDFAAPKGTSIYAYSQGQVVLAGKNGGYGNCVIIDHGNGNRTLYGHASKLNVENGQWVTRGQKIAEVGSTGNSTGNHLHFEYRKFGTATNPSGIFGAYANGTLGGNALANRLGLAGENYKPEILVDKATGESTYIDKPTVIDTRKTEVIGERQTAKLPKFANGTITGSENESVIVYNAESIEKFYNEAIDSISRIEKDFIIQTQKVLNDSSLSDFDKSQLLYDIKHDIGVEASRIGSESFKGLSDLYESWLKEMEGGTVKWSLDIYNAFKDAFSNISDLTYDLANDAVEAKKASVEARRQEYEKAISAGDSYIEARNFYNDWSKFGDSEVKAITRQIETLNNAYRDGTIQLEEYNQKIAEYERSIYNLIKTDTLNSLELRISKSRSLHTLQTSYYDITNSIAEAQHDINKELEASKTMYEYLNEDTRKLLFNQNDYNILNEELLDIQTQADKLQKKYNRDILYSKKENIEEITSHYQMQYEMLMKSYEIAKADLEAAKKKQQLNNVLKERNVRMFVNGSWQWVANAQDVINAQSELADAEYELRRREAESEQVESLHAIQETQDILNTTINNINDGIVDFDKQVGDITEQLYGISVVDTPALKSIINQAGAAISDFVTELTSRRIDTPISYSKDFDYSAAMSLLPKGSNAWNALNRERNAKIKGEGLSYTPYASGTNKTKSGYVLLGEENNKQEILITSHGKFIPITQPTFGKIDSGGIVFNQEQMANLRKLWDFSTSPITKYGNMVNENMSRTTGDTNCNNVIINGLSVDSGSENGKALINALRRYVGNH